MPDVHDQSDWLELPLLSVTKQRRLAGIGPIALFDLTITSFILEFQRVRSMLR